MNYFYSAATNSFYPEALKKEYSDSGTWPLDGVKVTESAYAKFISPEEGKLLSSGQGGVPVLVDKPELTESQQKEQVEIKKSQIISGIKSDAEFLQTQLLLDMISDEDKEKLKSMIKYIQAVKAVDSSNPVWPIAPDVP